MKNLIITGAALLFMIQLQAQQKEGKVIYERTMQIQININDNDHLQQMLPKTRTDKFELNFGGNRSLWKHVDEQENNDEMGGGGMQIKMMAPGTEDITYVDFEKSLKTEQREMFGKKFIISDNIRKLNWKPGEDTKIILGHVCHKATAQRVGKRMMMNMDNGKIERKEITDTSNIVAWFTTDIPVSAGPEQQGQLPGLILALDINDGRMVYLATELSPKTDITLIKEPTKGKKVTQDEFAVERNKMMEEMQKNNQGNGNRVIRIQN